jgi:hypothetical protein
MARLTIDDTIAVAVMRGKPLWGKALGCTDISCKGESKGKGIMRGRDVRATRFPYTAVTSGKCTPSTMFMAQIPACPPIGRFFRHSQIIVC